MDIPIVHVCNCALSLRAPTTHARTHTYLELCLVLGYHTYALLLYCYTRITLTTLLCWHAHTYIHILCTPHTRVHAYTTHTDTTLEQAHDDGAVTLNLGKFLQTVVTFFFIGLCLFLMTRGVCVCGVCGVCGACVW